MGSPLLILALVMGLLALYELRSVVRRPSIVVASYWTVLLFVSIGITVRSPSVSSWLDGTIGFAHLSRLSSNAFALLAVFAAQNAVYTGLVSTRRLPHVRSVAAAVTFATLLAMVLLFIFAMPLDPDRAAWRDYGNNPVMAAYRVIFLAYMIVAFSILAGVWTYFAFRTTGAQLRSSFALIAAGGIVGVLYALNGLGTWLHATGHSPIAWWGKQELSDPLVATALLLILLGSTSDIWIRIVDTLRKHAAYIVLRPLWSSLVEAVPDVAILPSRPTCRELVDVRDADFRLRRQVIEIRDARLLLRHAADGAAVDVASDVGEALGLDGSNRRALAEALLLWTAMHTDREKFAADVSDSAQSSTWPELEATSLWSEVDYLKRVSRYLQGSKALRRSIEDLSRANA